MGRLNHRGALIFTKMKKAMLGVFETILIVFVAILFLIVGLVIYTKLQSYTYSSDYAAIADLKALRIRHNAISMPEFSCEACGGRTKAPCFDTSKLDIFSSELSPETKDKYYSFFGKANLEVEQIYPTINSWQLYNKLSEGRIRTYMPVLLCNPQENNHNFGVLIIDVSPK